jgi:transposase
MTQEEFILGELSADKFDLMSREDLITFAKLEQKFRLTIQKRYDAVTAAMELLNERSLLLEDQYITIKCQYFGKSSEKSPKTPPEKDLGGDPKKDEKKRVLLPSQRYPNAPLIEQHITLDQLPTCSCCNAQMRDSGMSEDSEFLTHIPEQYIVIRQLRHTYSCGKCHGDLKTAPLPPKIKEGSSYSDDMVIDVAMTKYCDLIPIERYAAIAGRGGLKDLPPQSLIESTHYLADFLRDAYQRLKFEITAAPVLHADETPHRMLEGDKKCSWFLWGFSTAETSYFEHHDTRSGDVADRLLTDSQCRYLVSDVYSGYSRAVGLTNEKRRAMNNGIPNILHVYCNAHARRYFKQAAESFPVEAEFFIDQYKEIYKLEEEAKGKPPDEILSLRSQMRPYFEAIKTRAMNDMAAYSTKSSLGKAMNYFLKNYPAFTRFLENPDLPIDNNSQERLMRNPVIGRKTWYGTHSKRGAETAAVLFSLAQSCKLNKINPREYIKQLVADLHQGKTAYTPKEFRNRAH